LLKLGKDRLYEMIKVSVEPEPAKLKAPPAKKREPKKRAKKAEQKKVTIAQKDPEVITLGFKDMSQDTQMIKASPLKITTPLPFP